MSIFRSIASLVVPQLSGLTMFVLVGFAACSDPGPWQFSQPIIAFWSMIAESFWATPTQPPVHVVSVPLVATLIFGPVVWHGAQLLSHDARRKSFEFVGRNRACPLSI